MVYSLSRVSLTSKSPQNPWNSRPIRTVPAVFIKFCHFRIPLRHGKRHPPALLRPLRLICTGTWPLKSNSSVVDCQASMVAWWNNKNSSLPPWEKKIFRPWVMFFTWRNPCSFSFKASIREPTLSVWICNAAERTSISLLAETHWRINGNKRGLVFQESCSYRLNSLSMLLITVHIHFNIHVIIHMLLPKGLLEVNWFFFLSWVELQLKNTSGNHQKKFFMKILDLDKDKDLKDSTTMIIVFWALPRQAWSGFQLYNLYSNANARLL
jgi:hypothetical protein